MKPGKEIILKKEFLKLTVEELIENSDFIAFIQKGENQYEWNKFMAENPEFKPTAASARAIIELFVDKADHISDEDVLSLWKKIDDFDSNDRLKSKRLNTRIFMRYAAIFALALILSTFAYIISDRSNKKYDFSEQTDTSSNTKSRLILSDGTTFDLENDNSNIKLKQDEKLVIENNKVIDLSRQEETGAMKMNEILIPFGKKSRIELEDGTKIWLNAGSRLAFPTRFTGKKREVFLEGEAYFEVAHNNEMPFFVNTKDIYIKVLGTCFNISAYEADPFCETILVEGKVSISGRSTFSFLKDETILSPNQKASFNKVRKTISVQNETDVEMYIAWTEGWFKFSQQNVKDVLNKIQRFYNVTFEYDQNALSSDLLTGKLDLKESIDQVMLALSDVIGIKYKIEGNVIILEKK